MQPLRVLESCLYATDLDAAERFYGEVIGLELHAREDGRHVFFRCGNGMLLVFNPEHTSAVTTTVNGARLPLHGTHGAGHIAFAVPEVELATWRERLKEAGIAIESAIDWPQGGKSIYFRDPAGNSIELASPRIWNISE
jgi:catechol 2,3-dioxygenase-like lactoylglutathione lyase family enzyme